MITLFKTHDLYTQEDLDRMIKEIRTYTDAEPTDDDIYEYERNWWEDLVEMFDEYDKPVAILGSVRRWDGTYNIADVYHFDDINNAVRKIISTNACDCFEIYEDNDELCISTYNHDGGGAFQIKQIIDEETSTYDKCRLTETVNQRRK